uniref:VWFD domain-containing protein n=1 Tax=Neogobius melanostomus TaxID=47308 RepID=A0A8C6SUV2_9GOBI
MPYKPWAGLNHLCTLHVPNLYPCGFPTAARSSQACSTWGKYRYRMFDGNLFQLKSDCTYLLTSSCSSPYPEFSVQIRRVEEKGGSSIVSWVLLTLDGVTVEITLTFSILYSVVNCHIIIVLHIQVELDSKYQGQTCGLCGDFNGDPQSEFFKDGQFIYTEKECDAMFSVIQIPKIRIFF